MKYFVRVCPVSMLFKNYKRIVLIIYGFCDVCSRFVFLLFGRVCTIEFF